MSKQQLASLKKMVKEAGWEPGKEDYELVLAMGASGIVGPNIERVCEFTGLPKSRVREASRIARKNGIWCGSKIAVEWFDGEDANGYLAFVIDGLCMTGMLERVPAS